MDRSMISQYWWEIINAMNDGLMVVDREGKILMVNLAMERLTGFEKTELEGADCRKLNCDACEILRAESTHNFCILFEIGRVRGKRCLLMDRSGNYISVLKNASLIKDDTGEIIGAIETFTEYFADR